MVTRHCGPNIGRRFQSQYRSPGVIIAQGPGIVHTVLVAGDSELQAATYIKGGASEVIVVGLDKDQLRKVIPTLFLT